ncbi:hypothetical protein HDV00_009616 [Rhizophlyctis rosea]|nr:hypothetical protein HDV00_009616 [Rhizophlyctis rosea]
MPGPPRPYLPPHMPYNPHGLPPPVPHPSHPYPGPYPQRPLNGPPQPMGPPPPMHYNGPIPPPHPHWYGPGGPMPRPGMPPIPYPPRPMMPPPPGGFGPQPPQVYVRDDDDRRSVHTVAQSEGIAGSVGTGAAAVDGGLMVASEGGQVRRHSDAGRPVAPPRGASQNIAGGGEGAFDTQQQPNTPDSATSPQTATSEFSDPNTAQARLSAGSSSAGPSATPSDDARTSSSSTGMLAPLQPPPNGPLPRPPVSPNMMPGMAPSPHLPPRPMMMPPPMMGMGGAPMPMGHGHPPMQGTISYGGMAGVPHPPHLRPPPPQPYGTMNAPPSAYPHGTMNGSVYSPSSAGTINSASGYAPSSAGTVRNSTMGSVMGGDTTVTGMLGGDLEEARERAKRSGDPSVGLEFAKRLIFVAESGELDPDPRKNKRMQEAYYQEALKWTKKLATNAGKPGYPEAQFFLAECYGSGALGLRIDYESAFKLYEKASKQAHPAATYRTAVCYEVGAGTSRSSSRAMQYYRKAAALGDTAAMYKLGKILIEGLMGQERNAREGVSWLNRAARQADESTPHALHELGLLYEGKGGEDGSNSAVGNAIIPDPSYAYDLFSKAAQLGYAPSEYKLGLCYEYGLLGLPVDARRSIAWYSRAAEKGDPEAELALSGWYLTGAEGILRQSDQEAYLWARRAADKGLAKAEYAVGYYSENGVGVRGGDVEEARRWYLRASGQGNRKAIQRLREMRGEFGGGEGGRGEGGVVAKKTNRQIALGAGV